MHHARSVPLLTLLVLALAATPPVGAAETRAVQRASYEVGAAYASEMATPECEDAHVVCFALDGTERALTFTILDVASTLTDGAAPPVAAHVMVFGPTGFTTGWLCGEGTVELVAPRTLARLELALGGAGPCTWSGEHALANAVASPATRGEVVLKSRSELASRVGERAADPDACAVCPWVRSDAGGTGAGAEAYAPDGATSVGVTVLQGSGFWGPFMIADVHGTTATHGWHAGAGASDHTFDEVPDSTCACIGVWDEGGYAAAVNVGTFDLTGDGPSVDDTFASAGVRTDGALRGIAYGWGPDGRPFLVVVLP